jgi:asparagine synthase (glutamine-hydrolysing)
VCLSGNGGDEVFGGYFARYANALRIQSLSSKPFLPLLSPLAKTLEAFPVDPKKRNRLRAVEALGDNVAEYLILAGVLPDSFNEKLFRASGSTGELRGYYQPFFRNVGLLQGLMNAELRTKLVDDLLSVDDTMSMANSLELRVPLLDNRIVDLMVAVPWRMKYAPGTNGKLLLRKVARRVLPEENLRKPKWGFSVNVQAWFNGELGELIRQVVPESDVISKYLSRQTVKQVVRRVTGNVEDRRFQVLLWQLLGFHFWHRMFIENDRPNATSLRVDALVA